VRCVWLPCRRRAQRGPPLHDASPRARALRQWRPLGGSTVAHPVATVSRDAVRESSGASVTVLRSLCGAARSRLSSTWAASGPPLQGKTSVRESYRQPAQEHCQSHHRCVCGSGPLRTPRSIGRHPRSSRAASVVNPACRRWNRPCTSKARLAGILRCPCDRRPCQPESRAQYYPWDTRYLWGLDSQDSK